MKWKYLKKKFRYNPKRSFLFLFLFFFLTSFTIGYAFLTKELSIEGSSRLVGATRDIHFENIQVKSGSVTPTTAASITNPTTVTFGVQLDNPGDFYEFNIDVVNDGTFNAMIDSITLLPELTSAQQEYLEYQVTYVNGTELEPFQQLNVSSRETLKIRFGYIDGIDTSLYPLTDQELTIEVEIVYVQADENAKPIMSLTPGDYLLYYPSKTNYVFNEALVGGSGTVSFNPSELTLWRVLSINSDGTIDIISEHVSSASVYFSGKTGYQNFVGYLNVLASQYETDNITVGSRHFGYNDQTEFITDTEYINAVTPWTCDTGGNCNPKPDDFESQGGGDLLYLRDYNLVNDVLGTTASSNIAGEEVSNWLASRYYSRRGERFGRTVAGSYGLYQNYIYVGGAPTVYEWESTIRPIVTLSSQLSYLGSGTLSDPWSIIQ